MSYAAQVLLALGLVLTMFVGSVVLAVTYMVGNAWYASWVGRALVVLALSLALVTANTLTGYFLRWGTWSAFVTYGLILLAIVVLDVAFIRERRRIRREQRRVDTARKDHTIERTDHHG